MSTQWTIGALSKETGIPASTLRYYEREELLKSSERSDSNYRLYGPDDLERLMFIRTAQAVGFTIVDIKTLLKFRDGIIAPCHEISLLIESRLTHIQKRMKEFRQMQRVLNSYLVECHGSRRDDDCHVIGKLNPTARKATRSTARRSTRKTRRRP